MTSSSQPDPATKTPPLELLYEGQELVAVQKPSGVAVHRGWAPEKDVVMRRLRNQLGQWVWPIHRLDRGTSGVLHCALSRERAAEIGDLFQRGCVKKSYLALIRGIPPAEGEIDYAIPRSEGGARVDAFTRYQLLDSRDGYSVVHAQAAQGRFHQIRRHFKHLRHPLVGDTNYGDGKRNRYCREHYGLYRLALHAWTLRFEDPATQAEVEVVAPLPEDLAEPLTKMSFNLTAFDLALQRKAWIDTRGART